MGKSRSSKFTSSGFWRSPAVILICLSVLNGQSPAADRTVLIYPQFAAGGGVRFEIFISNPSKTRVSGTVRFFSHAGEPLSVRVDGNTDTSSDYSVEGTGVQKIVVSEAGALKSGYVLVQVIESGGDLDGTAVYQFAGSEVSVPHSRLTGQAQVFVDREAGSKTGIAVLNPSDKDILVLLLLFDEEGTEVDRITLDLATGERRSAHIDELFGVDGSVTLGSLHARSEDLFALVSLRQDPSGTLAHLGMGRVPGVAAIGDFGVVTISPEMNLNGGGNNVDSIAFWEAPDPSETLMFVTAKDNRLVEVWKFPFENNEQDSLEGFDAEGKVNGVLVDQDADLLYVTQAAPSSTLYVFSLPGLVLVRELEKFDLGGEPNLGILERQDRSALLLVTNDQDVFVLRTGDYEIVDQFEPDLESIETVLGDSFYQAVYVPDENDRQGVYAFSPDGRDFFKCDPVGTCTDVFGSSVFDDDAEGILLYSCPSDSQPDGGSGYIVVSDQIGSQTQFEIFDRETWRHLGALELDGVAKTDGIASTQTSLPGYPLGIFAAVDDDKSTAIVGWDKIFEATGLGCVD